MNIEQSGAFLVEMRQSIEQLNTEEDKLLWQLFLGEELLEKYPDWANRFLYWKHLNWTLDDIDNVEELLSYVDTVTDSYLRESLRDRMSLLFKKNILWRKGAHALFESLGYDFNLGQEQFEKDLLFKSFSVLYFDLDYFKAYNQLFGHIGGDLIIKRLSRLLLEKYDSAEEMVVRIAGEEIFLLLRKKLTAEELYTLAEKIQKDIQEMLKQLFFDLGQIYDINFNREEAIAFIEDKLEDHILLTRALDLNSEFDFSYQNKLKRDLVGLQERLNNCKKTELLCHYEHKMNLLVEDLQSQRNFDESSELKRYYYQVRESFFLENYQADLTISYFQKYNITKVEDLTPARFILLLKDLKEIQQPRLRNTAKEIYNKLKIYVGGLTMGVLYLDWDKDDRFTLVPFSVKNQMLNLLKYILLNSEEEDLYQEMEKFLLEESLNYHDLYRLLFKFIPEKFLRVSVQILNKYRFDKILNEVTHLEELQKHQKRNEINFKKVTLKEIENRNLLKERKEASENQVFQVYQKLKNEIESLPKYHSTLMKYFKHSPVNLWWKKLNEKFIALKQSNNYLRKKAQLWNRVFKYRYFDPLLGIFNDQFLLDFENTNYWYARRNNLDYTVVALDFDNLKAVNEAVDHYTGDLVLMESVLYLSEYFKEWLEKNDLPELEYPRLVRETPGEEFLIIFSGRKADEVKSFLDEITYKVTERVKKSLSDLGVLTDIEDYLRIKMGKKEEELKQIATFTSGIVNAKDYYVNQADWSFQMIQHLADKIGEEGKMVEKGKNYIDRNKN